MIKVLKILICMIAIILISCSEQGSGSDNNVIRVATPGRHQLFSYPNTEGKLEGYDIDVWEEIGRRLNRKIEWTQIALEGAFGSLESGKVDTVTQQIAITPIRMEKYYFSEPYFLSPYKLCVAGTNHSINSVEDMYGKKIGVGLAGSEYENIKRIDKDKKIIIIEYSSDVASVAIPTDVAAGKITSSLEAVIIFDTLKENMGLDLKLVGDVIFTEVNAFPFRKDEESKKLCDEVSKVVVQMREDGTLEELAIKWFGYNPMEGLDANVELEKLLATF